MVCTLLPPAIWLTTGCARVTHNTISGQQHVSTLSSFCWQMGRVKFTRGSGWWWAPSSATNSPHEWFHTYRLLLANSSDKQTKKLPWPPLYSLLKQVSSLVFLAFLFTPSEVCTSLHFSLAVRWLGTVLCTGVEATLRQGVVDWREEVKPLKVQVLLLCLNFGNAWTASSWMLNAAFR